MAQRNFKEALMYWTLAVSNFAASFPLESNSVRTNTRMAGPESNGTSETKAKSPKGASNDAGAQSKSNISSSSTGNASGTGNSNSKASDQKLDEVGGTRAASDVVLEAENESNKGDDDEGVEYVLEGQEEGDEENAEKGQLDEMPLTIETGDSVKVKQVLDDSTILYVTEKLGYEADFSSDNWKLGLMFTACCFALGAQFCPIPFPESRMIVGACCASYFILSGVVQYIISFVDCERILATKVGKAYVEGQIVTREAPLTFRTKFDRFQEWFNFIIHRTGDKGEGGEENPNRSIGEMYVGRYFTAGGEFDEERWHADVLTHIKRFEAGKYGVFKYDHKTD